jgi:YVTN family beta-propeller protein
MKRAFIFAAAFAMFGLPSVASAQPPLTLETTTPLPAIGAGDFDQFAVDLKHRRLFLSGEDFGSIETFDLTTGKHLQSVRGVVSLPHKIIFLPDRNELFVADGHDSSVKVLDATSLHQLARIPVSANPDTGVYDPATRLFYIGNGGKKAHRDYSNISIISVDRRAVVGNIKVPGNTLKGMLLDHARSRIYVSVRDKSQVVLIDTQQRAIVATYTSPDLKTNVPIGEDAQQRLFVGGRKPNELVVLNSRNGATLQYLPTVAESDDLTVDAAHRRIYVTGSTGLDVYAEGAGGRYTREAHYDTGGGKTSIYVPSLQRFYVARSRTDAPQSALLIYRVRS